MHLRSLLLPLVLLLALCGFAHAQTTTRTWVSGVGDDVNPASRTAPAKTFAGALAKTAAGGEVSTLDPGNFAAVTIAKSITISGEGVLAGINGANTTAVTINAPDTAVVVLRNLSLEGAGTGIVGVRIVAAGAVHLENCTINGFQKGISFESSSPDAQLFVNGCRIHKCTVAAASLAPAGSGAIAKFDDSKAEGSTAGFILTAGTATFNDCAAAGNDAPGFDAGAGTRMTLNRCLSSGNAAGVRTGGTAYLSDSTVTLNTGAGLQATGAGKIISFRNNRVAGNSPDGAPSSTLPQR